LWVRISCLTANGQAPTGHVSVVRLTLSDPAKAHVVKLEELAAEKDVLLAQLNGRLADLERELNTVYASSSWRVTAPLRKFKEGAIRAVRASPLAPPLRKIRRWLQS
jgi:hypothetical protein